MVLFIAPFYGTYFYLSLQQKVIQEAVQRKLEEGIPENELVKLTFFKKEIINHLTNYLLVLYQLILIKSFTKETLTIF